MPKKPDEDQGDELVPGVQVVALPRRDKPKVLSYRWDDPIWQEIIDREQA